MSKQHGMSSPEAGLAWEAVEEEVKSADNSETMKGSLDDKCEVDEDYTVLPARPAWNTTSSSSN
jgi:hypothetical protein